MEIIIFGAIFGLLIRYANLNRFDTINGEAIMKDFTVAKTIMTVIAVGSILLAIEMALGLSSYHIKPFIFGGIVLGGILFGIGMAVLGYCPGTLAVSMGEGAIDAWIGFAGGLLGGLAFTLLLPSLAPVLGPNLGKISLASLTGDSTFAYIVIMLLFSAFLLKMAFFLHNKETGERALDLKWLIAGIGLALLNLVVFSHAATDRPIGASTSFPYLADLMAGATDNAYFKKVSTPGNWEVYFLIGAFAASFLLAIFKKEFKFKIIHKRWAEAKGTSVAKRVVWAFVGGFLLLFGARMAGGCTSGHIMSGGMQWAISSLVFGFFVFVTFHIAGRILYRK